MRRALTALLLLLAGRALALDGEAGYVYENLDKGKPDWTTVYVEAAHDLAPRQTLYGALRETERFNFRDTEIAGGYYHPFSQRFVGLVEASASPDHNVLPAHAIYGQGSWIFGGGWVASGGARFNEYTDTSARVLNAQLERYFAGYRAFYGVYNGKPSGLSSASSQRLGIERYYADERSRVGASITWGREIENLGPPAGIITSDVRAYTIYGRHWFSPAWALTWDAGRHEQGTLYTRSGIRLGLRHHF
jgi:YaiO family outer membrane protein